MAGLSWLWKLRVPMLWQQARQALLLDW